MHRTPPSLPPSRVCHHLLPSPDPPSSRRPLSLSHNPKKSSDPTPLDMLPIPPAPLLPPRPLSSLALLLPVAPSSQRSSSPLHSLPPMRSTKMEPPRLGTHFDTLTDRVHHKSSSLLFLSLSGQRCCWSCFLCLVFLRCHPPSSMDESHRETRPATLLTTVWSPEHERPSSLMFCSLFSRLSPSFVLPTHSRKTEPPYPGTRFDALIWSSSPPELVVTVSLSIRTTSLLFLLFWFSSLPTTTIYELVTSWGMSGHLTHHSLVAGGLMSIFPPFLFLVSCCFDFFFHWQPPPSMDEGSNPSWSSPTMLLDHLHNIEIIGI